MSTKFLATLRKIIGEPTACGLCGDIRPEPSSQNSTPFQVTITVTGVNDVERFVRSQAEIQRAMNTALLETHAAYERQWSP